MINPAFDGCVSAAINCDHSQVPICVGCGNPIQEKFILRVSPNMEWHPGCLKCVDCGQILDETCTCFVRNGKPYCKKDYVKLFGTKCSKCGVGFARDNFVMRARDKIYHIECFRCATCRRQLIPGDEFALQEDELVCKADHEALTVGSMMGRGHEHHHHIPGFSPPSNGAPVVMSPSSMSGVHPPAGVGGTNHRSNGSAQKRKDAKTTRVRTVLNEKQLHTLRTCYAANCRPDALMKEQLTEMTGLSARVIRVWFQNKRCKDKKRSIAMKQMQEQQAKQQSNGEQNGNGSQSINGVAMVASAPVKNDSESGNPVEVQNYQQPAWKALSDFALQREIEPAFQQLMTQFSDHGQGSISDSSEICSIPSVSSTNMDAASTTCSTPLTADASGVSSCS